ncbi:MAG: hypothetical protein ABR606_13715 [Vicinamibacterales bacterium]
MILSQWKTARAAAVVGVLTAMLGGAGLAQAPDSGIGTWKLNVAKSKYSPGPTPKSGSVTFSTAGQGVKAVVDVLGTEGAKVHWEYTANFDGKPYPVTGNPDGDMVVAKRVSANTIETSYTLKGKPTTVNTRVVSADGKTLTVTTTGTNAQGQKVNNVQVFEKG